MFNSEESQHTLLLSIVSMLIAICVLGLEAPTALPSETIIAP